MHFLNEICTLHFLYKHHITLDNSVTLLYTVHGKGTYVTATNTELLLEEQKKELESDLERVIQKGRCYGISDEDIKKLFELILEG